MTEAITLELALALIAGLGIIYGWVKTHGDQDAEVLERLTRLETKLDGLAATVDKHNRVVERTFAVESNLKTCFLRVDELREELKEIKGEGK